MSKNSNPYGLSDTYWDSLDDRNKKLYGIIKPLRRAAYSVQNPIYRIEETLEELDDSARKQGGRLDMCPDFQRGHVWGQDKKIAFIEAIMRGTAPTIIRFNSPGWQSGDGEGDLNPHDVLCVDGLQRMTAMREFMAGKFPVFGKYGVEDFDNTTFSFKRMGMNWTMEMFEIQNRADLLEFYLSLNSGGVVHSPEELERVGRLLDEAKGNTVPRKKPKPSP